MRVTGALYRWLCHHYQRSLFSFLFHCIGNARDRALHPLSQAVNVIQVK